MSVIRTLLELYMLALLIDAICSYFPQSEKYRWRREIHKICNYSCDPIRKKLPSHLPFDFSPFIVILLIQLLMVLW